MSWSSRTGAVSVLDGSATHVLANQALPLETADQVRLSDNARMVDSFSKAGVDVSATGGATNLARGTAASASFTTTSPASQATDPANAVDGFAISGLPVTQGAYVGTNPISGDLGSPQRAGLVPDRYLAGTPGGILSPVGTDANQTPAEWPAARAAGRTTSPRPANMGDVARLAGVSHQTVSRVLNDSSSVSLGTRARVLDAMRQLDYRPNPAAKSLVTGRSRTLGVVGFDDIPEAAYLTPPLTTVHQPFDEVGRRSLALLMEQIQAGERIQRREIVSPGLVERRSVAAALAARRR